MPTTPSRPRVPNAPETIQRGLVRGFMQAAKPRVTGCPLDTPYGCGSRLTRHGPQPLADRGKT